MAEPPDLLFFDTFSHESSEELNLDLVQFPKPVYVSEVRIIPLGARVQGDFPGGVRLGATNPTQFQIDFFVNDLSKPGASTFETLGSLEYCQNGRIHMDCAGSPDHPRQIPTDGLVLRGWYTTITLAVYGTITKNITEQVGAGSGAVIEVAPPPVPVATPPPAAVPAQPWPEVPPPADVYPASNYPQDGYDQANYPPEYYPQDVPKDPRAYHHVEGTNNIWDGRDEKELPRDRELNHSREKDRINHGTTGREGIRLRSRSPDRDRSRERNSPRYSRSRSRDRDYPPIRSSGRDDFQRDNSRSPAYRDRERSLSRDKDWERSYNKRDDFRRHRQPSYERTRGGSYEKKRSPPYEKRPSSYERRPPSYENRPPSYEKRGSSYEKHIPPYEKRPSPPYEKRDPSYEKRPYDKRAPSYDRIREPSYDSRSRSPGRDDPRKRPRTPPIDLPRRPHTPVESGVAHDRDVSPDNIVPSDETAPFDHNSKHIQVKEDIFCKSYKPRKITPKTEIDKIHPLPKDLNHFENSHPIKVEVQTSPSQKVCTPLDSPGPTQEDNISMDTEQFEPILSDEDICDDIEVTFADMDYEINDYCGMDDVLKCFNPFRADWQQFVPFNKSPLYLAADGENQTLMNMTVQELCEQSGNFAKLFEIFSDFKKMEEKYTVENFNQLTPIVKEEWVHACEQLPPLITSIAAESDILYRLFKVNDVKYECSENIKGISTFLLNFCKIGLDYDLALSQVVATNKIRHIKCGIRLVESLSSHKQNELVVMALLNNNIDVFTKLFELYSKDHMALSIKLMILKALDACLGSEMTIEYFLSERFYNIFDTKNTSDSNSIIKMEVCEKNTLKNGYQILLSMLSKNTLSRIKFAVNALISKINLYELLAKLHDSVLQLNIKGKCGEIISEMEIELIINSLGEILCVCRNGTFELSQPCRFIPVSAHFAINKSSVNNILIDFFHIHKLVETCLYLLTCPLTYNYPVITNPIYEILTHLVSTHEGLLYLSENIKICDLLFQTLMQPYTHQSEEVQMIALQEFSGCTSLQQLGFEMAHKLQSMYYINAILNLQSNAEINENDLFDKLHGLYCLGFGSVGKLALASVLSMGDNILCLLNIYEKDIHIKTSEKDDNLTAKAKSPIKNYAVDLTVSTIQFSKDVNFLKKFGRRILSVAKKFDTFEQSIASNLQEVLPYLKPLEKSNIFLHDNLSDLVEILGVQIEHVTSAPGDLITCLRILRYLGIPEFECKKLSLSEGPKPEFIELKYKYVIIQLFSLDGVPLLVNILEKLCSYFEQPSLHTATFVSVHGLHIVNIVLPALELLNKMLTYVIQCRNTQFKDLTSIPVVLQTYNLMNSYPVAAVGFKMAQKACKECIEILLAHTQPIAEETAENESIHKSLWTLLGNEVIKYTITAPYTFIPGLLVLSEILPLPLPIQTKYTLSENELSNMVSNRKLWSAHLHTLSSNLTEMIQTICLSVCQPVVQLLRRVCIQLSDLASNMSMCVTRAVIDLLISNICNDGNTLPEPLPPLNFNIARILNFLACLTPHPSIKCTILHFIRQTASNPKSDDKYSLFIPILCNILMTVNDSQAHVQCQEYVVGIISNFYDSEITLLTQMEASPVKLEHQEDGAENIKHVLTPDIYLTNAVPSKDTLVPLISASLEYISNENSVQAVIMSILRTFFLLTEHDYGFYYFKLCLDKNKQVFPQLFANLVNGVTKEPPECLGIYLELLKVLQSTADELEGAEGLQFVPRTIVLNIHDIVELIGWNKCKDHPIYTLEKFLKEVNTEDELLTHVRHLLAALQSCSTANSVEPAVIGVPPVLGVPEHLVAQFNRRCLFTQGDAQDERLVSAYWLGMASPQTEDDAVETEMVPCDLAELTRTFLPPETDLVAEAERLLHLPPAAPRPPSEPPLFRTKRLHVPRDKRPYISPARGRGMSQQGVGGVNVTGSNSRVQGDAFRSRPPNTSRPPSLHVDDFLALEGCGAQPTGPTGYNKLPVMTARGGRGMRTRGGITITDRGRFASATPTTSTIYSRRGRGAWSSSTGASSGIAADGSQPLSSHFSRPSASQHFQSPLMSHATSLYTGTVGWGSLNRGGRRGRGLRNSRATFLR